MSRFVPIADSPPMDKAHSLEQMTGRFQSVRDGLPELVKNSKDQYARLGITDRAERQVIVILSSSARDTAVLDFAGAGDEDFEGWWTWSSREAGRAHLAHDIEAGHGNGGKAFMVRGSEDESYMYSSRAGRRTQMGFDNKNAKVRYIPGYFTDDSGTQIHNLADETPEATLESLLRPLGASVERLPSKAREILRQRKAFTLVVVKRVRDLAGGTPRRERVRAVADDMGRHPQGALTIESCEVWVMHAKDVVSGPLSVETLEPMPGFEEPLRFPIPETLSDPDTSEEVHIPARSLGEQFLEIKVTGSHLRMSRRKALNVIRVRNERSIVASWSVADLEPMGGSAYLYGVLRTPAITSEHVAGADRQMLADVPLVRALQAWTAERIREIASRVQEARASKESETARQRANSVLDELRSLMQRFLEAQVRGGAREGEGKIGPRGKRKRMFGQVLDKLELEGGRESISMPLGVSVPLVYTGWDWSDSRKRVAVFPRPPVGLVTEPEGVVDMPQPGMLRALSEGRARMWLRTDAESIESNVVTVTSVGVGSVEMRCPKEELKQGERVGLEIRAFSASGIRIGSEDMVYETSVDEHGMGQLGRAGVFTAGGIAGTATPRVRYGPRASDSATCLISISNERVPPPPGRGGADIPHILLCGSTAPGRDDLPPEQQTHGGGEGEPSIIDYEPQWRREPEVIWINPGSKESLRVRRGRGPSGMIGIDNRTFCEYLALKCFEILRRLRARQALEGREDLTFLEFLNELAAAEVDAVEFIDAAYGLVERLLEGRAGNEV